MIASRLNLLLRKAKAFFSPARNFGKACNVGAAGLPFSPMAESVGPAICRAAEQHSCDALGSHVLFQLGYFLFPMSVLCFLTAPAVLHYPPYGHVR
jgi:hypothetical protein